jgi:hypothetical protein
MTVRVRSDEPRLEVQGTLRLPASTIVDRHAVLSLAESAQNLDLALVEPGGREVPLSAQPQPGDEPPERRKWLVRLPPATASPAGADPVLKFSYALEQQSLLVFHVGPDGAFGGGINASWYPQVIGADSIRRLALGDARFEVPRGHVVYTAGEAISSADDSAAGRFGFHLTEPVYISFATGPYIVQRRGRFSLYLLRKRRGAGAYLRRLGEVIAALSAEFGPFPYRTFALVEVPADAGRAAGFDGASLDGIMLAITPFLDQPFNLAFYGHEIGHQWWAGVIRRKGPAGAYLMDEALAQWGSLLAVKRIRGPHAAERYRRLGYPGYYFEYSGFSYLRRSRLGLDHELATLPLSDGTVSRRVADSKGMLVWDMLAATVGRDRFRKVVRAIVRQHWFQRMTWPELWRAIERGAGQDLGWFYRQWFERTGAPSPSVTWRQEGGALRGAIEQPEPHYRMDLAIGIEGKECGRKRVERLRVEGARTEFQWEVPFAVSDVRVDPKFEVLHWTEAYQREAAALEPYTRGDLALLYGKSDSARAIFAEALASAPRSDPHGLRFLLEFGMGQALLDLGKLDQAREHLNNALSATVVRPEAVPEVYAALADLAIRTGDSAALDSARVGERVAEERAMVDEPRDGKCRRES